MREPSKWVATALAKDLADGTLLPWGGAVGSSDTE